MRSRLGSMTRLVWFRHGRPLSPPHAAMRSRLRSMTRLVWLRHWHLSLNLLLRTANPHFGKQHVLPHDGVVLRTGAVETRDRARPRQTHLHEPKLVLDCRRVLTGGVEKPGGKGGVAFLGGKRGPCCSADSPGSCRGNKLDERRLDLALHHSRHYQTLEEALGEA